jgi:hypothetical protein
MISAGNRMINCAKGIAELTPYEGVRCFVESPAWSIVAHNLEQAASGLAGSTFEQWATAILMFGVVLPTLFVSWLLAFSFVAYLFGWMKNAWATWGLAAEGFASWNQTPMQAPLGRRAQHIKNGWAGFMLLGGAALLIMNLPDHQDSLMLMQGGWEIVCGAAIYFLPLSWWNSTYLVTGQVHPFWHAVWDLFSWLDRLLSWLNLLSFLEL